MKKNGSSPLSQAPSPKILIDMAYARLCKITKKGMPISAEPVRIRNILCLLANCDFRVKMSKGIPTAARSGIKASETTCSGKNGRCGKRRGKGTRFKIDKAREAQSSDVMSLRFLTL